jgi:pimeloyl-ACP methyl ester carboxylesterase
MDIILIPGLWLTARSWDDVVPRLEEAGHIAHPLTLPGMDSVDADRSAVTRQDHVDAVVDAIDAVDAVDGDAKVLLVGHSMGGVLAWAAADARLDRVAGVVFLASEPGIPDESESSMFPVEGHDVPMPAWDFFDDEMVEDLDDDLRIRISQDSVPSPLHAVIDGLTFGRDALYDLPVTMVTAEYDEAQLRKWVDAGEPGTEEIAALRNVQWVDLHSGHWPQYSRVDDATRVIVEAAARG